MSGERPRGAGQRSVGCRAERAVAGGAHAQSASLFSHVLPLVLMTLNLCTRDARERAQEVTRGSATPCKRALSVTLLPFSVLLLEFVTCTRRRKQAASALDSESAFALRQPPRSARQEIGGDGGRKVVVLRVIWT